MMNNPGRYKLHQYLKYAHQWADTVSYKCRLYLILDNGKIVKLKGGLYATVNPIEKDIYVNRFEIATALHEGAYCAYHTALEYYGLATQVYYDVHVVTEKRYSPMVIEGLEYQFFQNEYNGGIIETKQNTQIRITELERTIIDCLDRLLFSHYLLNVLKHQINLILTQNLFLFHQLL